MATFWNLGKVLKKLQTKFLHSSIFRLIIKGVSENDVGYLFGYFCQTAITRSNQVTGVVVAWEQSISAYKAHNKKILILIRLLNLLISSVLSHSKNISLILYFCS